MTTALIIEDEPHVAEHLKGLLKKNHHDIEIVDIAGTIALAEEAIKKFSPDLLFMDVELGTDSSFTILEHMPHLSSEIIFTTGYDKYAVQAIKHSCLEYLLKPIDSEELSQALQKFSKKKNVIFNQKRIELLLENINHLPDKFQKIAIPTTSGYEFIKISEILYCKAESNYTWIYTLKNNRLLSSRTLKEYEEVLPTETFFRNHKSYLVNLNCIRKYSRIEGNYLEMENGDVIDVSTRKMSEFLARIHS